MGFPGAVAGLHLSGVGLITGPQESGRVNYGTTVNGSRCCGIPPETGEAKEISAGVLSRAPQVFLVFF